MMTPDDVGQGNDEIETQVKRWLETGQFAATDLQVEEIVVGEPAAHSGFDFVGEHAAVVDGLQVGSWLEFRTDKAQAAQARLAAIDPNTRMFVFTDKRGYIVAKRSRNGLIADFRRNTVRVCSPTTLLHRTLVATVEELKRICMPGALLGAGSR